MTNEEEQLNNLKEELSQIKEGLVDKEDILDIFKRFSRGEKLIKHGSSAPTYNPTTFFEQFYLYESGSTYRLYVYLNGTWRYVDLT